MTKDPIVSKKAILPFILITSLFALWGFANAVTDPMVKAFQRVLELTNLEASLVQMAFYGGYFTMALPASLFIRRYSYKRGILLGLALYASGAFLFYPAAVTEQFIFFLLGLYILTFGLAFLETTANPYILSMGSPKTATQRLNLAQAFNPLGLIGGLLTAQHFVLSKIQSDDVDFAELDQATRAVIRASDLLVIRDPYLVLGGIVLMMFILILVSKMPAMKDKNMQTSSKGIILQLLNKPVYVGGVFAQTANVAAQIMCWTYIYHYAESIGLSAATAGNYQFVAFILFFIGRFICTFLLRFFKPSGLLAGMTALGIVFMLGTIFLHSVNGLYCLVAVSLCMSLLFPTIYGLALGGLDEDQAKIGAAGLVMAIVGGALMPTLQGIILDIGGSSYNDVRYFSLYEIQFSFVLPLICFIGILVYARFVHKRIDLNWQ